MTGAETDAAESRRERSGRDGDARIVALDRARTFIILLVVLHHSVLNYTYFGNGDRMRWLGFDLVVLFNDSFFMAFMFLISGLFVRDSLARKGPTIFLRDRAWRLGVPFLLSIFVLMPIAYYPIIPALSFAGNDRFQLPAFLVAHAHRRAVAFRSGMVPVGAAGARCFGRRRLVDRAEGHSGVRPADFFRTRPADGGLRGISDRLNRSLSADAPVVRRRSWLEPGGFPLPIQTSRILLYAGYFFTGVGVGAVSLQHGPARGERRAGKTLAGLARALR